MVNIVDFLGFGVGFGFGIDHVLEEEKRLDYLIWKLCVIAWWLSIFSYLFWLIHEHWKNGKLKIFFRILCVLTARDLGIIAGFAVATEMGLNVTDSRLLDFFEYFDKGQQDWSSCNTFVCHALFYIICKVFEEPSNNSQTQTNLEHQESQTMTRYQRKNQKRRKNNQNKRQRDSGNNLEEENEEPIPVVLENGNNIVNPERESKNLNQTRNNRRRRRNQTRRGLEAEHNLKENEPNILIEPQNMNDVVPDEQMWDNWNQNVVGEFIHKNSDENQTIMRQKTHNKFEENLPNHQGPVALIYKLEEILECPICLEQIRTPKMLPCQHSFCMDDCLKNLVDSSESKEIICPICRKKCSVPRKGFPNNYTLQSLLELQKSQKFCET